MPERQIARREGVSTLTPASPSARREQRRSGNGSPSPRRAAAYEADPEDDRETVDEERADEQSRENGNGEGTAADQRATRAKDERLQQREEELEEDIADARRDKTPQRVRDLQSALDRIRGERDKLATDMSRWPAFIRRGATEGWDAKRMATELDKIEQTQREQRSQAAVADREPSEIIDGLLDSDDPADLAFARFLNRRKKKGIAVTRTNVDLHREEFDQLTRAQQSDSGKERDRDDEGRFTRERHAPARRQAPPVGRSRGGSANSGGDTAGWKPNTSTIDLLSKGFREQDDARAAAAR